MKKALLISLLFALVLTMAGCRDKSPGIIGGADGPTDILVTEGSDGEEVNLTVTTQDGKEPVPAKLYKGDGYLIYIPKDGYRYEKDYDDGVLEEKWESIKRDDIDIQVTTYKNTDALSAQGRFLRENEDYIFEDLMGFSTCGMEPDGDTLWFNLHEANGSTYIVSWEYPKNTAESTKSELSEIAKTFKTE